MKKSAPAKHDKEKIRSLYGKRLPLLVDGAKTLEREILDLLHDVPHVDRVYFRAKDVKSFVDKACQINERTHAYKYTAPFDEIEDQIAGRILVFFTSDIAVVSRKLIQRFNRVEAKMKQPADPNTFDYESQHFVFAIPPEVPTDSWKSTGDLPTTFEMQVRTLFMHAWAEPQHDLEYKAKQELSADDRKELAWAAASAWGADQILERMRQRLGEGEDEHEPA